MEDELWPVLYYLFIDEDNRRGRRKHVQLSDAVILLVAMWAVPHDRPIRWACRRRAWRARPGGCRWATTLPSPATMSRRLRTLATTRLLEQVFFWRLLALSRPSVLRRVDAKPLPVAVASARIATPGAGTAAPDAPAGATNSSAAGAAASPAAPASCPNR